MRLSVRSLRRTVKGDLPIEFVQQDLTSYGGLELVRRYLHRLDVLARLRRAVADVPSDYGGVRLALLVVALFYAGARRLEHLRYLAGDQLIARFCGVARFPTAHTISNWLKQFTQATLAPVIQRPSATMGRRQMRKSITIATVWRYISHGLRGLTGPVRLLALAAAALLLALTPWFSAQVFAQTVVATIPVVSVNPSGPVAVGVNPATNRVYVCTSRVCTSRGLNPT